MPMSKQNGFTLLELLTTVSVVAIILSMGVPSMTSLVRSNRIVAYTNDFVSSVHTARAEAVNNVVQVTVCKSDDQATCNNTASWNDGWIVFVDNDEDEIRDLGGTPETLIRAREALEGANTLQSAAFDDWIAFRPNGLAIGSTGNAGTFSLCNEAGAYYGRDISISRTGSSSVGDNADGACP